MLHVRFCADIRLGFQLRHTSVRYRCIRHSVTVMYDLLTSSYDSVAYFLITRTLSLPSVYRVR